MKILENKSLIIGVGLIFLAVLSRWLPHPPNVAPITAIALFSAVYFKNKLAFIIPFVSLVISDLLIGFYGSVMFFVYASFLLSFVIGRLVQRNPSVKNIILGSVTASSLFFLITNFAVWWFGTMYTKDVAGLYACYLAAIPFFRNTMLGDFFYTGILFTANSLLVTPHQLKKSFTNLMSYS